MTFDLVPIRGAASEHLFFLRTRTKAEIILMIEGETEIMIDGKIYHAGPGDFYIAESKKLYGIGNATDNPVVILLLNGDKRFTVHEVLLRVFTKLFMC